MNMQAMLKQAQALQKDMLNAKNKIDEQEFVSENQMVKVTSKGTKEVVKVEINKENFNDLDDLEMLEDMMVVAINENNRKIDKETEEKLGKYTKGMPGLF